MRKDITVAADIRETRGKNEAHRTRRAGKIPAVVYGAHQDPISVAVNPREILRIVASETGYNTIFNLQVNGSQPSPVMVVDQQIDPVRGTLLHADFKRIDLSKRLRVTIPVLTQGEPKGVKQQGGVLDIVTRAVEIECLPDDIPEKFVMDISELMMGQSRRAGDIPLSGTMKLMSAPDTVIAHVVAPRGAEEAAAAPEAAATPAAAAEPEVVKKGKKEEGAAPAEKGKAEDKGKKK
ncbi:MAG TPA: 50S ribosomal protein L25 [Bryobacteraceae bacterium]|nr:50S ribosomal protein L25 [Bryobacteraceae bacterium]